MKKTRILFFEGLSPAQVGEIAHALKNGAVIICPTDTIYGISAVSRKKTAEKIRKMKKRDSSKPFILLADSMAKIKRCAVMGKRTESILKKYWPGPLTAVLKAAAGKSSLAFRIPGYNPLLRLIRKTGEPLISTSANISGMRGKPKTGEVIKNFYGKADYILLSSANPGKGKPSTIVDFTSGKPFVLREGAINETEIVSSYP